MSDLSEQPKSKKAPQSKGIPANTSQIITTTRESRIKWPADAPVRKTVAELIPYARNARTHSEAQVAQIAASIREWGWTNPILIDETGGIIAGHGRVLAARKLKIDEVPCIVATGWSEAQKRAYILADNQLAMNAGWDMDLLKVEIGDLKAEGFELGLIGFDGDFLDTLMSDPGTDGLTDPDDVPEVSQFPVSATGDVWQLGKHRLLCGDSTSADGIAKLMAGQSADLCFTSPPYAQQRDYKKEISDWDALMNGVFSIAPVKDGAQVLVNLGLVHEGGRVNAYWDAWLDYMESCGWPLFGWYVWDQGAGMPGDWRGRLAPSHEFVFHFSRAPNQSNKWVDKKPENVRVKTKGTMRNKDGTFDPVASPLSGLNKTKVADSVIRVTRQQTAKVGHPAGFPVALCEYIYNSYAKAGDWVFEPFSGSGTSIIACEKNGMNCAAIELAPEYVDVAVKRWQAFTGKDATLDGDGRTFNEVQDVRHVPA